MKPFLVTDESINRYGFWVLTSGIETTQFNKNPLMYYMHNRNLYSPKGNEVIGKWQNFTVKEAKGYAEPIIDDSDDFSATIKGKVDRGFLRMASIGIQILETSSDKKYLKKGQTRPTVTKCRLIEISIVDQGANDNAIQLYDDAGATINLSSGLNHLPQLQQLNLKPDIPMSPLKPVALALSLPADATETEVLSAVEALKTGKTTAETKLADFETKTQQAQQAEASKLITDAAVKLGLTDAAKAQFETTYAALFKADHANAKLALKSVVATAKPPKGAAPNAAQAFLKDVGGFAGTTDTTLTFDYLSKHNPNELKRLKAEAPETFAELVKAYSNGVRHKQ